MDRIVAGMEGTPMVDSKSKSLVAYHEVGHAVCATLTPGMFFGNTCISLVRPTCSSNKLRPHCDNACPKAILRAAKALWEPQKIAFRKCCLLKSHAFALYGYLRRSDQGSKSLQEYVVG